MTSLLQWREAEREDRGALQSFTCTEPDTKLRLRPSRYRVQHPRPWEKLVQGKIRSLEPRYRYPVHVLLGEDSEGIAAVSVLEELDGPRQVDLCLMALAWRFRFRGGGYADEMADKTFDAIERRAIEHGVSVVSVVGLVDENNDASQKFCRRMKLGHTGVLTGQSLQQWSATHILGDPPPSA